jgi:hypothetical protein
VLIELKVLIAHLYEVIAKLAKYDMNRCRKKSTSPPELWGGVYFTPELRNSLIYLWIIQNRSNHPRVVFDGGFATVNMAFVLKILVSPLKHYAFTVVELTLVWKFLQTKCNRNKVVWYIGLV